MRGGVNRHTNCAKDPWLCSAKSALRLKQGTRAGNGVRRNASKRLSDRAEYAPSAREMDR